MEISHPHKDIYGKLQENITLDKRLKAFPPKLRIRQSCMSCHYFQHCTEEQPVQSHKEKITKDIILIEKKEAKLPFFGRLYDSLSIQKCWEPAGGPPPVAKDEGGSTYAKAGLSLRSPPGNSRASTTVTRACLLYYFVLPPTPLTLWGAVPHHLFRRRS